MKYASLVLLTALALGACSHQQPAEEPAAKKGDTLQLAANSPKLAFLKVATVEEAAPGSAVTLTGKVTFDEDHTQRIASPVDGRATKILVQLGDKVKPGQSVVGLSSPMIGQLQADAQKAQKTVELEQREVDRAKRLFDTGAGSEKELQEQEADLARAKADQASAQAHLRSINVSASDPSVGVSLHTQIGGIVVERNVLIGQEVRADATTPLLTVSDLGTVWVMMDVYEQDLGLVKNGGGVTVRVPAYPGRGFDGTVTHVGDVLDPNSRTVKVRCTVPNGDGLLKPEMFAKAELKDTSGAKVIVLPASAVLTDSSKQVVMIVEPGNNYRPRPVEVGPEVNGQVRVLSGLKPGEQVVTDGAIYLKDEFDSR